MAYMVTNVYAHSVLHLADNYSQLTSFVETVAADCTVAATARCSWAGGNAGAIWQLQINKFHFWELANSLLIN